MAQFPGIPWDQRPDYVALTQRVDPAGIATNYNPPRPGVSATDVTSFVFGQATITVDSWPEVMYYLNPTPEWLAFRSTPQPPQKVDANGQPMVERFPRQGQQPRPLLDFRVLPDTICSQEELWWIELWRRMDPRIHWQDILMRVELPNRTAESDRKLQNSTNNLINRHEHKRFFMLSWHSTGTNRITRNVTRSFVLNRVNGAHPPLPYNSTRGLTPGLIDPRLGNVPGNSIPFPPLGQSAGRLRVQGRPQPRRTTGAVAANAAQGSSLVPSKRDLANSDRQDDTDNSNDGSKGLEGTPLSDASARPQAAQAQKRVTRHGPAPKTGKRISVKGKGQDAKAKRVRRSSTPESQDTREAEPDHQEDHGEQTNPPVGQFLREGDLGFEAAYQASLRERRRRQVIGQTRSAFHGPPRPAFHGPPRPAYLGPPAQYVPESPTTRRTPQDDVSDSELLGNSEDRTLWTPAERSNATPAPRVPAPPRDPANSPSPPQRPRRTNPMTRLLFEPLNRRPEALSGYSDTPLRRGRSSVNSRVLPSTRVHTPEDNHGRAGATRNPNPILPVEPANRPQSYYYRSPGGRYYHEGSPEIPTSMTSPRPASSSGMEFTQNHPIHGHTQLISQPPQPSPFAQLTTQYPNSVNDPTSRGNPPLNHLVRRLSEERRRHDNASSAETRRHDHALLRIELEEGGRSGFVPGYLERDDERVRKEKQGSTDDGDE